MGRINVLPFAVANLIAAGEVVDRPASVIKELLENAIDSGADRITVEIQNGGVTFMRVSDNGCGMEPEDIPVAIRRHATSKIRTAEDLDAIMTLGFRGEALAAIASVSRMRIMSKPREAQTGAMLEAVGGEILSLGERACADGTTVIVEDLFANVPARRKFLKKDVTEATAVCAAVEKIALSKPHIAFRLIVDGDVRLETVGDNNLKNTIYAVFGRDFAGKLLTIDSQGDGIGVHGFVGRSDNVRANRNYQNFFINGRYVKSRTACAAIEQAYTSYIPPEKFPCCVLYITVNPSMVDVNVHPAKLEVKFSNEKPIFEAIYYAVRNALEENTNRPDFRFSAPRVSDMETPVQEGRQESVKRRQLTAELYTQPQEKQAPKAPVTVETPAKKRDEGAFLHITAEQYAREYAQKRSGAEMPTPPPTPQVMPKKESAPAAPAVVSPMEETPVAVVAAPAAPQEKIPPKMPPITVPTAETAVISEAPAVAEASASKSLRYRIVGEVFNSYVVVELEDKMLLIDKHAAHERVIFERMKSEMLAQEHMSQMLLLPIEVMMTSDEVAAIVSYGEQIEAVGFSFTAGKYTLQVHAIPDGISTDAVPDMLTVMAERIRNETGTPLLTRDLIFEKALYQASCKAAIKAGREYPPEYVSWLVDRLMELPNITFCPHGRPVAMELSKKKIDHQFERS